MGSGRWCRDGEVTFSHWLTVPCVPSLRPYAIAASGAVATERPTGERQCEGKHELGLEV